MSSTIQQCPLCGFLTPSLTLHVSHYRLVHSKDPNFFVRCSIDRCDEGFWSFSAFNSHVYRRHRAALGVLTEHHGATDSTTSQGASIDLPNEDISDYEDSSEHSGELFLVDSPQPLLPADRRQRSNAEFLMMLSEGRYVSQQAICDVIAGCRKICQQIVCEVKEGVVSTLADAAIDISAIPGLMDTFTTITDPFDGIDSQYLREKFYSEHMNYVPPQEIPLGVPFYTNQFSGSKRRKVRRTDYFHYVPLLDTLKKLLSHKEIQAEVLNSHFADANELRDFCDGVQFKTHSLFSRDPNSLQIIAYYDEVEVVNPIGSYVARHKLGCLFFTLGNIRPQYRSTLKAINLIAVAKYKDISKYGIDAFLSPFVDDLKTLFCDGITTVIGGKSHVFYGGLLAFLADNLAAHTVGGFKQSMSFALRICRTCMITGTGSQSTFLEEYTQLRNPEAHFSQCELLTGSLEGHYSTNFGINRRSVLEDVPGFSVTTSIPHDIMHDLFEGVVPYELKLLITHFIQIKKYFTIDFLNDRIDRFDFTFDKPSLFDGNLCRTSHKIRQSASQMMALSRHFPLLIGDIVPQDDEHWTFFLLLLRICNIALSPVCTFDTIPYLTQLIEEKLSKFNVLYPGSRLIPKFHYMIHYPSQIEKFGPLIHSWTMRHESKLSFIKRCSKRSFKNVTQTAAKKHQLWQCYKMNHESTYLSTPVEISTKSNDTEVECEADYIVDEISRLFPSANRTESRTKHPTWVKLQSFVYKKGVFLLLTYDTMEPTFGRIVDIVVFNGHVIFSLEMHKCLFFDNHLHCFAIESTEDLFCLPLEKLQYNQPFHCKHSFASSNKNKYIILPFMY